MMLPTSSQRLFVVFLFISLSLPTEAWVAKLQPKIVKQGTRGPAGLSTTSWQPRRNPKPSSIRTTQVFLSESSSLIVLDDVSSPLLVALVALGLGVAAQGFINQMLEGDQGLGAYLKDGSGYNKSGFQKIGSTSQKEKAKDPLPWLKLPQLDFVEVAGQPSKIQEQLLMEELESLRQQMNELLEQDKLIEASAIRDELESRMKEAGVEYKSN